MGKGFFLFILRNGFSFSTMKFHNEIYIYIFGYVTNTC